MGGLRPQTAIASFRLWESHNLEEASHAVVKYLGELKRQFFLALHWYYLPRRFSSYQRLGLLNIYL
jgi:hypothetical protein